MNRNEALQVLIQAKPELVSRFGVVRLALFGSLARNEAHPGSDVDVMVSFDGPSTSQRYFGVQFYLEDALGRPVDLVTEKALRPELKPFIEQEAVNV
ncbi:MAG: nucleotidyltransferase family protein [Desulfobulbaceae bacterium]|nr:nucleotidyltransferase family protein [Desulfobulbaceae bacterium]